MSKFWYNPLSNEFDKVNTLASEIKMWQWETVQEHLD